MVYNSQQDDPIGLMDGFGMIFVALNKGPGRLTLKPTIKAQEALRLRQRGEEKERLEARWGQEDRKDRQAG